MTSLAFASDKGRLFSIDLMLQGESDERSDDIGDLEKNVMSDRRVNDAIVVLFL